MKRKISSSFTEIYKVFYATAFLFTLIFCGTAFSNFFLSPLFPLSLFFLLLIFAYTLDILRMKEVELTEVGLIITRRFFFKEESTFVSFENVEIVRNKHRWMGNYKRISVKFIEPIKFGKEISFLSNRSKIITQVVMVEELNRSVRQSKKTEQFKLKFY